jgi:membrane-associated phospholipid phosphatase
VLNLRHLPKLFTHELEFSLGAPYEFIVGGCAVTPIAEDVCARGIAVKWIVADWNQGIPSGHGEHVTVLFGFLFYLTLLAVYAQPDRRAWLLPIQILCVYFIALIGVGRVVEGDHQPSDVLAGYLVAVLMLPLVITFYRWLGEVWQRHQLRKEGQVAARARYPSLARAPGQERPTRRYRAEATE